MSVTATYGQEIEAIETILSKANLLLREFEDREKNVQRHVSTTINNCLLLFTVIFVTRFLHYSFAFNTCAECKHASIHHHLGRHEKQVNYDDSIVSLT